MPCCAVFVCKNRSETSNFKSNGITYHRFPRDPKIKEEWISATNRGPNWWPLKRSTICSAHFEEKCFKTLKNSRRLFEWAVPTLRLRLVFANARCTKSDTNTNFSSKNPNDLNTENIANEGDFYNTSKASENSSTNTRSRVLPMVAKVYLYLEKEYEYMKTLNGDNCDLSPLADILRRTAEATGISEEDVITTLENENLSDHLPERAKKLRQTIEDLQDGSDDDLISDEEMLEDKHADIEKQKEKIGEGASEPTPCGSIVFHIPSEEQNKMQLEQVYLREVQDTSRAEYGDRCVTSDTQVKVEPEEDEVATSVNNLLLQLEPPRTNATVSSDDGNKMEIEQYTFIICNPSEKPTTSNPEDTAVKLEPLDD